MFTTYSSIQVYMKFQVCDVGPKDLVVLSQTIFEAVSIENDRKTIQGINVQMKRKKQMRSVLVLMLYYLKCMQFMQ